MLNKLLKCSVKEIQSFTCGSCLAGLISLPKCCASGDEETTFVQLTDSVMLDGISISHCNEISWSPSGFPYHIFQSHLIANSHCVDSQNHVLKMHHARFQAAVVSSRPLFSWFFGSTICEEEKMRWRNLNFRSISLLKVYHHHRLRHESSITMRSLRISLRRWMYDFKWNMSAGKFCLQNTAQSSLITRESAVKTRKPRRHKRKLFRTNLMHKPHN